MDKQVRNIVLHGYVAPIVGKGALRLTDLEIHGDPNETCIRVNAHPEMQGLIQRVTIRGAKQAIGLHNGDFRNFLEVRDIQSFDMAGYEEHLDFYGASNIEAENIVMERGYHGLKLGGAGGHNNSVKNAMARDLRGWAYNANGCLNGLFWDCTAERCVNGFAATDTTRLINCEALDVEGLGLKVWGSATVEASDCRFKSTQIDSGCTLIVNERCELGSLTGKGVVICRPGSMTA